MKKKIMLFVLGMAAFVCSSYATILEQSIVGEIPLSVRIEDPVNGGNPVPRTPVLIPTVSLDGYTLSYDASCWGNTLQIEQNGVIVYSTIIPSDAYSTELPSYLSGDYELQIIRGNFCFYGDISL